MPTYEYVCKSCGHLFEIVQSMKDDPLTECPECGGELRKVFAPPAISFKGSGFYATDHGKRKRKEAAASDRGGSKDQGAQDKKGAGSAEKGSSDAKAGVSGGSSSKSSSGGSEGSSGSAKGSDAKAPTPKGD